MIDTNILFSIYKENDLDKLLKNITGYDLNENSISYKDISDYWKFLGNNSSNGSNIGILKNGEKGLIERITNAVDSVIEKHKTKHFLKNPNSPVVVIEKAFPNFYKNVLSNNYNDKKTLSYETDGLIKVNVYSGSKSNKPTIDVIDKGTGLYGAEFPDTILSLNKGNKLSTNKNYLIGAFGQGGSTSLPFAYATLIVSKIDSVLYYTIIKRVNLNDYKNHVYVYLTIDNEIPRCELCNVDDDELNTFIDGNSGTLIRLIEIDISKKFRDNEVTKPGMLLDYINTELFNVGIPVKVSDKRENYKHNSSKENRNAYGTNHKLKTSSHVHKEYTGTLSIEHKGIMHPVEYFVILPKKEEEWGKESVCKSVFEQFNIYCNPIIYIVNGQAITTEKYTKINNAGLNYLKYRLLIVVNLDILGNDKYKFFTSDRSQIVENDLTRGFLDKIIQAIANIKDLKRINDIIAKKSINNAVDKDLINDIAKEVKSQYSKFLTNGPVVSIEKGKVYKQTEEEFFDHIRSLNITSTKRKFYKNELVTFVVTTGAEKHINDSHSLDIFVYIDDKAFYDVHTVCMNGRIQYQFTNNSLNPGNYTILFRYFEKDLEKISSERVEFEVLTENILENVNAKQAKDLDLKISTVQDATLICSINKNEQNKVIEAVICLEHNSLKKHIYNTGKNDSEIAEIKSKIIKPMILFSLFSGEKYSCLEDEEKNSTIVSLVRTVLISLERKE